MTDLPRPGPPAAVAAFLRGLDRRARLFVGVQSGRPAAGGQALAVVAQVFASEAGAWPIAEWPRQYWRLLLAAPALRQPATPEPGLPLPGIARLPAERRAAVLLHLVAGLPDADAAAALGLQVDDYQARIRDALPLDALGQPDLDVWRAWRAAAERELARMPEPAPEPATGAASAPASAAMPHAQASGTRGDRAAASASPEIGTDIHHRRRMRWLWAGVAACVIAMIATFFLHPRGRAFLDAWRTEIKREPLPEAQAPKARFDPNDPALHPDRALLAAPEEVALAQMLPLLSWLAVASATPDAADPVLLPPAPEGMPAVAEPVPAGVLLQRMQAWDALPARVRGQRRGAWAAWQALPAEQRAQLRTLAQQWRLLPADRQQAARARFDALPFDARHGGWLGPALAASWPRVAPLFAYLPDAQRGPVLQLLRQADAHDMDALERLSQTTPPEQRDAVRTQLLRLPAAQRRVWIVHKLQG